MYVGILCSCISTVHVIFVCIYPFFYSHCSIFSPMIITHMFAQHVFFNFLTSLFSKYCFQLSHITFHVLVKVTVIKLCRDNRSTTHSKLNYLVTDKHITVKYVKMQQVYIVQFIT